MDFYSLHLGHYDSSCFLHSKYSTKQLQFLVMKSPVSLMMPYLPPNCFSGSQLLEG